MKIGDKFSKGYQMLSSGQWEGIFITYEAVTNLYELDAIDDIIFAKLSEYVRTSDMSGDDTEANQWLKILFMDSRYAGLLLQPGDLLENLVRVLNKFPEIEDDVITDSFMEGRFEKVKYADGAFYYIQRDTLKNQVFLIKRENGVSVPLDFDVEDFSIDRVKKRIEFSYVRGSKSRYSMDYDGNNKTETGIN